MGIIQNRQKSPRDVDSKSMFRGLARFYKFLLGNYDSEHCETDGFTVSHEA